MPPAPQRVLSCISAALNPPPAASPSPVPPGQGSSAAFSPRAAAQRPHSPCPSAGKHRELLTHALLARAAAL